MDRFASAQESGHEAAKLKVCKTATCDCAKSEHQQYLTNSDNTTTISTIPSSAITATFNTAELLEQILSYLPAPQLLTSKATSRTYHNAIEASPMLCRKTSTFLRLGDVDEENDLFNTDTGGEVVFPIEALEPLAFFYPADGKRRLFVRFEVDESERFLGRMGKAKGFGSLRVVDQGLRNVRVGWHCGCFEEGRAEVELACPTTDMVTFGDVLNAIEGEHLAKDRGACGSLSKFWVDGSWKQSREMRDFGPWCGE